MSIIVSEEDVIALADVPQHVPVRRGGKKLHASTAFGWAKSGTRGVRLETIRIGGTLCTSVEALQRFFEALSATDSGSSAPAPLASRTPAARQRAIARADADPAKMGT